MKIFKECEWYGQLYCSGDIIIDLFSWKFLKTCAGGKMVRFLFWQTGLIYFWIINNLLLEKW